MFCFLSFKCAPGIKGNITNITSLSLIWNLGNYTKELPGQKLYYFDRFQTKQWYQQMNTWFSNDSKNYGMETLSYFIFTHGSRRSMSFHFNWTKIGFSYWLSFLILKFYWSTFSCNWEAMGMSTLPCKMNQTS